MNIKALFVKFVIPMALFGITSCSNDEIIEPATDTQHPTENTVLADIHIEGMASMDEATTRAGGGLQLQYSDGIPFFRMNGDEATVEAHCVFKPLKAGSQTELDNDRALYGTLIFKRQPGSEPSMVNGKAVAVKLISDGKVALKGNTSIMPGERWCVMGIVGGAANADGKEIKVDGFTTAFENYGTYTGVDAKNNESGSAPFLSKWVKLAPVKEMNKVASSDEMNFKFQGILFTLDVKNGTDYNLMPTLIQLQSTELTSHVAYDLSASNNIDDKEEDFKWQNTGQKDATDRWYITPMGLGNGYRLDPKSKATNDNFLYDVTEPKKNKVTILFWTNTVETNLAKRTGFFVSSVNTEAKPAWKEKVEGGKIILEQDKSESQSYKYVLTSDVLLDDIIGTNSNHSKLNGKYASDIKIAPSMDFLCAKTLQRSLKRNRGKYVHLTITVPERPVMPIETMAQNNLYGYKDGKKMDFVGFPGTESKYGYAQYSYYAKDFTQRSDANNWHWKLPTHKQWYGLLMAGHNPDNAHNWNENAYNWIEGDNGDFGQEEIEFSNGTIGTFYAAYSRPEKGNPNQNKIYGLRFFKDQNHKIGTDQFCLTRYERRDYNGKPVLAVESVWLGSEYAKLYDGIYLNVKDWIHEISLNDNDGEKSLFHHLRRDFVIRYLLVEDINSGQTYYKDVTPKGYSRVMTGYFYGPESEFKSNSETRAIAFKNNTLFTGPSSDLHFDFTNYKSQSNTAVGYVRPMRRNFMKFEY